MSEDRGVGSLLQRVSTELAGMKKRALDLQDALGALATPDMGAATVETLQDIDRMTQELGDLSGYLRQVSVLVSDDWEVDAKQALGALTLASLSSRLSSDEVAVDAPFCTDDIDLFDAPPVGASA